MTYSRKDEPCLLVLTSIPEASSVQQDLLIKEEKWMWIYKLCYKK